MSSGATAPQVLGGRYELGRVLGQGGMGVVRAATDLRLDRQVAVKLLHPGLAADENARGRFEDEARSAARLVHPNVVAVFDSGEHDGTPFIVMESLPGRSLADDLDEGTLPLERVHTLAHEVLDALAAAHAAGVIHRDVKPANVLVTSTGATKVADFGIAKTAEGHDRTATGMIVGTIAYLAPERLRGGPASVRTDLYATGVLLYEALTGGKPTGGEVAATIRSARPDADQALVAAIERATAEDPDRRFGSATEMRDALRRDSLPLDSFMVDGDEPTVVREATATWVPGGAGEPAGTRADEVAGVGTTVPGSTAGSVGSGRIRSSSLRLLSAVVAGLLVLVLLVVLLAAALRDDGSPSEPGDPASELERTLQELEEAVQP